MTQTPARLRVAPRPPGNHTSAPPSVPVQQGLRAGHRRRFPAIERRPGALRRRFRAAESSTRCAELACPGRGPRTWRAVCPYRQSERLDTYRPRFVEQLIIGHAYYCWCSTSGWLTARRAAGIEGVGETGYDRLCLGKTRDERAALPGFTRPRWCGISSQDDAPLSFTDVMRRGERAASGRPGDPLGQRLARPITWRWWSTII